MTSPVLRRHPDFWLRAALFSTGVVVLSLVYIFQRLNIDPALADSAANTNFIINRTARLIINDVACFLIIYALFKEQKYLKIAFWVFLLELLVILPGYLVVKLTLEGASEISSPFLSQVHRLIVNPMLMILLIIGFGYQKYINK